MSRRKTTNPLFERGYTLVLDGPSDLVGLDADVRECIGPELVDLFTSPREELLRIASSARHEATRTLCEAVFGRPVVLEVNVADPLDPWSADTFARFRGASSEWSPGLRAPVSTVDLPASCPPVLREFYSFFGGLNLRYAWSGELVMPARVRQASSILLECGVDDRALLDRAREDDAHGFWEVDGDWLCWLASGDVGWVGLEWSAGRCLEPTESIASALTRLYRCAAVGERFHG